MVEGNPTSLKLEGKNLNIEDLKERNLNIKDLYESRSSYLKTDDLNGNKVVVQITVVSIETVTDKETGKERQQVVLSFAGKEKRLGLNKTNAEQIAQLTGTGDIEKWVGWKIKLKPATTQFAGRTVNCIRISDEYSEPPADPKIAETADDVPF